MKDLCFLNLRNDVFIVVCLYASNVYCTNMFGDFKATIFVVCS
jgi:hypothetical protein